MTYPDTVRARTGIRRLGNTSYVMAYEVWSEAQQAVVGEGEGVIVQVDYGSGEKVALDKALRDWLSAFIAPGG
ncbi:MAG: hypothetical protein AAGA48_19500 [Myxococcota bacterium]